MTPHPKLSRLTPPERVTAALMAVGGIRGLLAAVKTSGHNVNSRRAYVGAFDALADAVAEAEREAFRRGQEEMREIAADIAVTMAEGGAASGQPESRKAAIDLGNVIAITITNAQLIEKPANHGATA